jgi:diadenosine tetraphosphate (Ap4A) HIT family hydrolase
VDHCPICSLTPGRIWLESEHAIAFAAAEPATDGHMIVAPRKHVSSIYELPVNEQQLWALVGKVRGRLLPGLEPTGFSIGFTDSSDEGPSAPRVHVHVVPRRQGDQAKLPACVEWVTENLRLKS